MPHDVRALWLRAETIHAVTYFSEESRAAARSCGLKGFWMGYFGFRAAPLGPVDADVVTDAFYNFAPRMVQRSIPDAWTFAMPEALVRARSRAAMAALREASAAADDIAAQVVGLAREVVTSAADDVARPLYTANRGVAFPDDALAELWQHCTTIREHRGDGHVIALRRARVDGCEAHVLHAADTAIPIERFSESRGWAAEECDAAVSRLQRRGLVDDAGQITDAGRNLRVMVERATDAAARVLFAAAPADALERLVEGLDPLARDVAVSGVIRYPNPIGLPDLTA